MVNIDYFEQFIQNQEEKSKEIIKSIVANMFKDVSKDLETIFELFQEVADEGVIFDCVATTKLTSFNDKLDAPGKGPFVFNIYNVGENGDDIDLYKKVEEFINCFGNKEKLEIFKYWKKGFAVIIVEFKVRGVSSVTGKKDYYWTKNNREMSNKFVDRLRNHFNYLEISHRRGGHIDYDVITIKWNIKSND